MSMLPTLIETRKRRSVTAFCHIEMPNRALLGMWGRRHAHCRLHRYWHFDHYDAFRGGESFPVAHLVFCLT
jgi:hypothetical protein